MLAVPPSPAIDAHWPSARGFDGEDVWDALLFVASGMRHGAARRGVAAAAATRGGAARDDAADAALGVAVEAAGGPPLLRAPPPSARTSAAQQAYLPCDGARRVTARR